MVERVANRPQMALDNAKIHQHAGGIKFGASRESTDEVVVPMETLALAMVFRKKMGGCEGRLDSYCIHEVLPVPLILSNKKVTYKEIRHRGASCDGLLRKTFLLATIWP